MPTKRKPDKAVELALRAYPDPETMRLQIKEPEEDFGDTLAQFLVRELSEPGTDAAEALRRLDRALTDIGAVRERLLELAQPWLARPWTVILLYPDYMLNDYPHETSVRHVCAADPGTAAAVARAGVACEHESLSDPDDMYLIAVFPGHLMDRSNGEGDVEE